MDIALIRIRIEKNQTKQFLYERSRHIRDKSWQCRPCPRVRVPLRLSSVGVRAANGGAEDA